MKLYKEDGEAIPAVKVQQDADATPTGYSEVVDIVEVSRLGASVISPAVAGWVDMLCLRSKLKAMIYSEMQVAVPADVDDPAKWALLTAGEKRVAAEFFLVGAEAFFLEVDNDPRRWILASGEYRRWTQAARTERADRAESLIFMRMASPGDAKLALAELNQISKDSVLDIDDVTKKLNGKAQVKRLNQMYIEGLEDLEHDGVAAIGDWIKSTAGTPFENNGFMNLGFPFKPGHTAETVQSELLAILDGTF